MEEWRTYGPITRSALSKMYGVDVKTLSKRIKKAGISIEKGLIFPKKIKEVFDILGPPPPRKID